MTTAEQTLQKINFLKSQGFTTEAAKLEKLHLQQEKATKLPKDQTSLVTEKYLEKLITQDVGMIDLKSHVRKLVNTNYPVLIIGESGTGKELIARALHGDRAEVGAAADCGKFVDLNCAGIPEGLVESELFGHTKGAFTGAEYDRKGLIEYAYKGTLFLDEVGDMPLSAQAKLLRFIQENEFRVIGARTNRKAEVRIVAATHYNLADQVNKGLFRLDLFARLRTFMLVTKPLRDRRGDIKLIVDNLDPEGKCWKEVFDKEVDINETDHYETNSNSKSGLPEIKVKKKLWETLPLSLNVRDLQSMVAQYKVLGKVIG